MKAVPERDRKGAALDEEGSHAALCEAEISFPTKEFGGT
jgi:hypothetical protein